MPAIPRRVAPSVTRACKRLLPLLILLAALAVPNSQAEGRLWVRKISGILPPGASLDDNSAILVSPNSLWAVYIVKNFTPGAEDIFSVPLKGGNPIRITPVGFDGRDISDCAITPDSSRVVYRSDTLTDNKNELFSAVLDGSSGPQRISSGSMIADGDVYEFQISPDSTRVVYRANQEADTISRLYSTPIGGGPPIVTLNDDVTDFQVEEFMISPDGEHVVYSLIDYSPTNVRLYFTPIASRSPRRLDKHTATSVNILSIAMMPDSSGVVYSAILDMGFGEDLYRADFWTGAVQPNPVKLTSADSSLSSPPVVTSDSQHVIFSGDGFIFTSEVNEFYRARTHPTGSGDVEPLYEDIPDGSRANGSLAVTPNGAGAVFSILDFSPGKVALFANSIANPLGTPIKLSHATQPDSTAVGGFSISPNSLGVVFIADTESNNINRLYSNSIYGGMLTSLTPLLVSGGDVLWFNISSNNQSVVFKADGLTDGVDELFVVPIAGPAGAVARLNRPMANPDGDVSRFLITPDSQRVVYSADAETEGVYELYLVEDVNLVFMPAALR